jgi:hypothetical protein
MGGRSDWSTISVMSSLSRYGRSKANWDTTANDIVERATVASRRLAADRKN